MTVCSAQVGTLGWDVRGGEGRVWGARQNWQMALSDLLSDEQTQL